MQEAAFVLVIVALVLYVIAWGLYLYRNVRHDTGRERIASRLLTGGFFAQTMALAALTLVPSAGFFTTANVLLLISWLLFFACFMFEVLTKKRDHSVFLLLLPLALLVLSLVF